MSWAVVSIVIILSAALLYGIVKQGSDTIVRQEAALTRQVGAILACFDHNAALSERVRTAAERTTTLNERSLRRVSADLHDGPGQTLSLALLRLDSMRDRAAAGRAPTPEELAEVETVLREAMSDMRSIAAGLRLPELASLDARDIAERAVSDHERGADARRARDRRCRAIDRLAPGEDRALPRAPGGPLQRGPATGAVPASASSSPMAARMASASR